jgi:CPA1 family monovalent cation:H+ antiporter
MSDRTREHLDIFWELVDEILNAVLFLMIGLEVLVITFTLEYLWVSLLIIPSVLFARFLSVGFQVTLLRPIRDFSPGAVRIMTWGGLRGGISVALALSLPISPERNVILAITYAVVIFAILVQGLTLQKLVKKIVLPLESHKK